MGFLNKNFLYSALWRGIQLVVKQGINLYLFFVVAAILTPSEVGTYSYLASTALLLSLISDFGVSTATSKFVAEYALTDRVKLRSVFINAFILSMVFGMFLSVVLIALNGLFLHIDFKYLGFLIGLIFLIPISYLYDGIYRGLKKFKVLSIITVIVGVVLVVPIYILIKKYGILGALIGQVLFYLALIVSLAINYSEINFKFNQKILKEIATYSFVCGVAAVGYQIFSRTDIILLGHYHYLNQIATYDFINRIFIILTAPFAIIAQVIAPDFTHLKVQSNYKRIYSELKKYSLYTFLGSIVIAAISFFAIPLFIKTFYPQFNNEFLQTLLPLSTAIFVATASAITIDLGIIIPTGYANIMTILYLVLAVVNFLVSLFLLKIVGYIGPIFATLFTSLCMLVFIRVIFFRKIKNNIE